MKRKLFNLFLRFFKQEFESQLDIEKRLALKEMKDPYQQGYDDAKQHFNSLVDNFVNAKFSQMNFLVNPDHVFQVTKTGIPYLNLEPASKEVAAQLKQSAKTLQNSVLFEVLKNTIRQRAIDQAIKNSTEWNHVLPGKMMVYNLDIIEAIVKSCAEIDLDKISDAKSSTLITNT